jgi:hypothetical protein
MRWDGEVHLPRDKALEADLQVGGIGRTFGAGNVRSKSTDVKKRKWHIRKPTSD